MGLEVINRERIEALFRLLLNSGDMTPMAVHQLRAAINEGPGQGRPWSDPIQTVGEAGMRNRLLQLPGLGVGGDPVGTD